MLNTQRKNVIGIALPFLMLALANIACDLEQSLGELHGKQEFLAQGGWDYDWYAQVTPGAKYEVIVSSIGLGYTGGFLVLEITNGLTCADCSLSNSGTITADGIRATFIAPDSGRARIYVYVREGTYECSIEIREIS